MPDIDDAQATADRNMADAAMAILSQRRYRHLLIELFKKEHRTNQQSTLASVLALLVAASDLHRDQRTDMRNKAGCELADNIRKQFPEIEFELPYI